MNDNTLKSGSLLKKGEYSIIRVLGQGGFGITYEAEQVSLGRKVAVKEFFMKDYCDREDSSSHVTLSTSSSSRELVERFRTKFVREAKMIAGLDHDHIVKIIDVFEEKGTAYYVMEYIGGGCLGDGVKAGKAMPEREAVESIRQIASALKYLHNKGIIHFDVKPSNVLRTEDGKLKLIDFGISKHYDETGVQTSSTPVGISKGYAPLEQYQQGSDIKSFTPATDIYSLGATLFALLTGSNPPEASIVNEDGVPAIEGISPVVMHAIEKAMQPRRKDRPQSVEAFMDLLDGNAKDDEETVVPSKPKETSPAKVQQAASEEKKQKKPFAKYGLIGGIAIVAILSVVLFLNRGGQPEPVDSMMIDGTAECVSEFESTGAEREFKIEKNFEEKWTYTGVPEWCSINAEEGKIVLSITENKTKESRTATVEFQKKDGAEVLAKLTVIQTPKGTKGQQQVEEKVYGSVKISSTPSGASIWIDGKDTKKTTPEIIENLAVGSHKVVLKLYGYEDCAQNLAVKKGENAKTTYNMTADSPTISTGKNNGHDYVDLGLSVKWATCNVGATSPEGYGDYFAWGETQPKGSYSFENLKYCTDCSFSKEKFSKYVASSEYGPVDNKLVLDSIDDAANVNWGGNWRIPSKSEFQELLDKCAWKWSTINGVCGYKMTSIVNGNCIFLPASGQYYEDKLEDVNSYGCYWLNSLDESMSSLASRPIMSSFGIGNGASFRNFGLSIRPVCP